MTPFRRAKMARPDEETVDRLRRRALEQGLNFDLDVAPRLFDHPGELFVNDRYEVIRERVGPLWHLSIKPLGRAQRSWHEYQQIKNELVGAEHEGVELFPAEGRLVDTADQYHLWVVADPAYRFPFGYETSRVVTELDKRMMQDNTATSVQIPPDASTPKHRKNPSMSKLSPDQVDARIVHLSDQEENEPEAWCWLSFCDPDAPEGSSFLGVAIVRGRGMIDAVNESHRRAINPGGEVMFVKLPPNAKVAEEFVNRLLTRAEAEAVSRG